MDKIDFRVVQTDSSERIEIFINGQNLLDLVRETELPYAAQEGHPELAGHYIGLPVSVAAPPSLHLLGTPNPLYSGSENRADILECPCGEPGCWPLQAKIVTIKDAVMWGNFVQPHRGENRPPEKQWNHEAMGEFTFDRTQYENALAHLKQ